MNNVIWEKRSEIQVNPKPYTFTYTYENKNGGDVFCYINRKQIKGSLTLNLDDGEVEILVLFNYKYSMALIRMLLNGGPLSTRNITGHRKGNETKFYLTKIIRTKELKKYNNININIR